MFSCTADKAAIVMRARPRAAQVHLCVVKEAAAASANASHPSVHLYEHATPARAVLS